MRPALLEGAQLTRPALEVQSSMAIRFRRVRPFDVPGETAVNAGNFSQQNLAEFDLRGEHSRRCARAGQVAKLGLGVLDSAERIPKDAIRGIIDMVDLRHWCPPG